MPVAPGTLWECGRLIVRTSTPPAAVPLSATHQVGDAGAATDTGWTVTATDRADVTTDPDQAAHYQRTLPGPWSWPPFPPTDRSCPPPSARPSWSMPTWLPHEPHTAHRSVRGDRVEVCHEWSTNGFPDADEPTG
ncbi:hypothetical protein OIE50_47705 [Streptomyces canus]|uniref:hypothetical protein n=1 Tax=Streptomyces canus TaxID=58343 RepID=UPI00324C8F22